jgi:hypothetical protein
LSQPEQDKREDTAILVNGEMGPAAVQSFCQLDEAGRNLIRATNLLGCIIRLPSSESGIGLLKPRIGARRRFQRLALAKVQGATHGAWCGGRRRR